MAYYNLPHIKISAVASAVPLEIVKLENFVEKFGADYVEKYKAQTGVHQFRKTREHQTASDLAFAAAENIIVQKAIDNLMNEKTVFVIAHRLSTIQNADRIAVINEGELAELGTHEELIQIQGGVYSSLYEMQFKKQTVGV